MGSSEDRRFSMELTEEEDAALSRLAAGKDMRRQAVMRQALRLYQTVDRRLQDGERMSFSGDAARAAAVAGLTEDEG